MDMRLASVEFSLELRIGIKSLPMDLREAFTLCILTAEEGMVEGDGEERPQESGGFNLRQKDYN